MRLAKCKACGFSHPFNSLYRYQDELYCEPCAQKLHDQAAAAEQAIQFEAVADPTVCFRCGSDNGSVEFPAVAGVHACPACTAALYNRPFPSWLKAALAVLLALLGYSLVHGARYFNSGRQLVAGERLLAQQRYAEAVAPLEQVVQAAPVCEKCILLLGKALFLSGRPDRAWQELQKHNNGQFKESRHTKEIDPIARRAADALDKSAQARQLYDEKKYDEAVARLREAEQLYPELPGWQDGIIQVEVGAAFERKDYDAFLRLAEDYWKRNPQSAMAAAQVASARACRYAVSGDSSLSARAEEMLGTARGLATSAEEQQQFQEYDERIRHRLRTREIIEKDEYDRRYRPQPPPEAP